MKKIGITFTAITEEFLQKIQSLATDYEVIQLKHNDPSILECEVVFGGIDALMVKDAHALKWLHTSFAGVDSLLKPEVNFPDEVVLTNSAGTYGIGISEYLICTTLMLMRRNMEYAKLQFKNEWKPLGSVKAIYGSKITVIGLGDIGENYAKRCKAMGATVTGVVRTPRSEIPISVDKLCTIEKIDEAILDADVVALCLPGTSQTHHLFDKDRLNKMKPNSIILNIGRGTAIDTTALIEALQTGHLAGAGLDVTEPEPLPSNSALWQMENVIITPHISGNQSLALTNTLITEKFISYLEDYLAGRPFVKVVDKLQGY